MGLNKLLSSGYAISADPISRLSEKFIEVATSRSFNDENIGKLVVATESLGSNEQQLVTNIYNNLESTIKTIASDFGITLENYQLEAATIGGMVGTNVKSFITAKIRNNNNNAVVSNISVIDGFTDRPSIALEAYDERENRNAQMFSIVYNLLASRQDDFGETFFPTIVINPTEVGATISAKLFYVYNDFKRSVTGSLAQYGRKNIIRAYTDPEILKNELTRVIPVLRTGGGSDDNSELFASSSSVPSWSVTLSNNISVTTSALKPGNKIDLIGISQTNELLNSGIMGPSDNLDTYIKLESVYLRVTQGANTDIIRVNVEDIPSATFTYAPQGNYRNMILNFDSDSIVLDSSTVTVSGSALTVLTELATHRARISFNVSGTVSLDRGDLIINRGTTSLVTLRTNTNMLVTGAVFNSLAAKLASAEMIGYTIIAYRANSNIRQRGQLFDSQVEYRIIPTLYRSPMSVIMPVNITTGSDENVALQTLITATGIRASNEAVSTLLKTDVSLSSYKAVADTNGNLPEISAIGHFYVKPTYFSETLNLTNVVDSLKSHERIKDIRAALVEKIRFYANEMYRESEYKAAALVMTGNQAYKPVIIVGTDPVIANYLQADGDLRTLGESFDVKVVSTLDSRVAGRIFISFGVFDASRNTAINPLNFGNMLYSPEVPFVGSVSRDGQMSKELIVTPRFLHIVTLPVLTKLTVTGLPNAINKVTVNMKSV